MVSYVKYRADIDGLRAVAVLAVVAFHAFPNWMGGGFVGVDIFFVISGFLISGIIMSSMQRGSFSFREFYGRRIVRIFPALILVMGICIVFGWFALLPDEYKQLGKHIAAGASFISNLIFWQEAGYFDNAAQTKPLQHLWSLGIEEQFYIVWPLVLYLAWKRRFNLLFLAIFVAAISFVVNIGKVSGDAVQAFYSPVSRFWELLIGSILAYITLHGTSPLGRIRREANAVLGVAITTPAVNETALRDTKSLMGILLIGIAFFLVSSKKVFPGWWALLPTLGTYLVISAGQQAWFNRTVLAHRAVVWVGLISYPLYLWHWPLLSFVRIMEGKTPSTSLRFAAITLAFALAWLTYRLIEYPIRFGRQGRAKVAVLVLLMAVLAGMGYSTYKQDGLRQRMSQETLEKNDEMVYRKHWDKWSLCPNEGVSENCRILDPSRKPDIALIGDSHAGHLASGLAELFSGRRENVIVRLSAGCLPFFEMESGGKRIYSCEGGVINKALEEAVASPSIRSVMLAGYALVRIQGNRGRAPSGMESNGYVNNASIEVVKRNANIYKKAMYLTLERLVAARKQVIFIVDSPELYFDPKECVSFRPVVLPGYEPRIPCAIDRALFERRSADYHRIVAEARVVFPAVKFINTYDYFCDKNRCYGLVDGKLLYQTSDHLTPAGSRYLVRNMARELN